MLCCLILFSSLMTMLERAQNVESMCERRVALNPVAHSTRAKDADESDNSLQEDQKTQMDDHTPIKAQYFTYPQTYCSLYISPQHAG